MSHHNELVAWVTSMMMLVGATSERAINARMPQAQTTEHEVPCEDVSRPAAIMLLDAKGVEFGPWLRRFVNRIRRQMRVPADYEATVGCAVVSFRVHRDGTISDVTFKNPSSTTALSETSRQALVDASPVERLPDGYDDEFIAITSTFYFNMSPPPGTPEAGIPKP